MQQLAFSGLDRPSWADTGGNKRRAERELVVIDARLHQPKLEPVTVTLLDFSGVGCAFATAGQFRTDQPFFLHLDGMEPLRAKTVWNDDLRYGCEFEKTIHEAVAQHITRTLSRGEQRRDSETRMTRVRTRISRH